MKITQALLGEHAAMYPLLSLIEKTAPDAELEELKTQAAFLQSTLMTHAAIEDALLRPAILPHLPKQMPEPNGELPLTDHQVIEVGINSVLMSAGAVEARRLLLDTVATTRKHFHKEETIIFALAERQLSEDRQQELGAQWARMRNLETSSVDQA